MKLILGTLAAVALTASAAAADSFLPVSLGIHIAPTAQVHKRLRVAVDVSADAGVLDNRFGPLRIEVRLAQECGGDFQHTTGTTLLNKLLEPQPVTGRAYSASVRGFGRPQSRGSSSVCVYLEEAGNNRVWAHDESLSVRVVP